MMKKVLSDEEVIRLILHGGPSERTQAFESLYRYNFRLIEKYITRNSGTHEDAADIFQDALTQFYMKLKRGRFELNSAISTYLYSVCRNLWLKKLRTLRKDYPEHAESMNVEPAFEIFDESESVLQSLNHIGDSCREVLIDFYYNRMSMVDIASKYGLGSPEAAKNKKYRCLQRLASYFKEKGLGREDFNND